MFSYFFRRNVFKYVSGTRMTSNIKIDMKTLDLKALTGSIIEHKETSHGESNLKTFCTIYKQGTKDERYAFLQHLAKEFYINRDRFESAVGHYLDTRVEESAFRLRDEERLSALLTPKYLSFFHILGRSEGGVKFLVDMREDLLDLVSSSQLESPSSYDVRHMNTILKELLSLWFTVGFMKLERITWQSSCEMLQKISDYEAVHPVRNWTDLKRRVGPYRRCYVITHSCMPGEPIVVLHTALTNSISASIQRIIVGYKPDRAESQASDEWEDDKVIKAAIFYSISSTQKGLQGIELGKYLIKGVVKEVKAEFPHIQDFSSLSPIPGFKNWLVSEVHKVIKGQPESRKLLNQRELEEIVAPYREDREPLEALLRLLRNNGWYQIPELVQRLEAPLMRLCAFYLYHEKRRGYALNGVANFHLKNGAVIWRLNWLGDISPRGLSASCSIMVNYRYYLDEMETNRQKYLEHFTVPASDIFLEHLKPLQSSL